LNDGSTTYSVPVPLEFLTGSTSMLASSDDSHAPDQTCAVTGPWAREAARVSGPQLLRDQSSSLPGISLTSQLRPVLLDGIAVPEYPPALFLVGEAQGLLGVAPVHLGVVVGVAAVEALGVRLVQRGADVAVGLYNRCSTPCE
jgi:hypothetical protein